jgi:DNA replication ATP-dependent helicase Dna2
MDQVSLPTLFNTELEELIEKQAQLEDKDVIQIQYNLLQQLFSKQTSEEHLHFSTLFSKVAYICQKHKVPGLLQYETHIFRKAYQRLDDHDGSDIIQLGYKVLANLISLIYEESIPLSLNHLATYRTPLLDRKTEIKSFVSLLEVVVIEDLIETEQFLASTETGDEVYIAYNLSDRNENFNPTIQLIKEVFQLPITLNLIDVEIDKEGICRPRAFVVLPDYLMDVTAVANCFKSYGTEPDLHLLNKLKRFTSSPALMLGNIANFFLDELVNHPDADFDELFIKVFKLNPLAFALMDDTTLMEIRDKAKTHFHNLHKVITENLSALDIDPNTLVLEPSFYSQKYGIQGRLDALALGDNDINSIIELKSGKIFKPNHDGINANHYIQTLLYDLLVRSVYGTSVKSMNYILYSALVERSLRYATPSNASQMDAIQIRNNMLALEEKLCRLLPNNEIALTTLDRILSTERLPKVSGYEAKDLIAYEELSASLSTFEKTYFLVWLGFIAREQKISKLGEDNAQQRRGLSSLWRHSLRIKEEAFSILQKLELVSPEAAAQDEAVLRFNRSELTNKLANFRKGDLVVLYPYRESETNVLKEQMFKCTLVDISASAVSIRLRAKQSNIAIFETNKYWSAELDKLDTGFNNMYRSVYQFMSQDERKKKLILGLEAPRKAQATQQFVCDDFTPTQQGVFDKAIASQDYFLLWGPPGTGKTSVMLKNMVQHFLHNSSESILLMAYTNRAVDEICSALLSIDDFGQDDYIRIGSKYASDSKYAKSLLSNRMKDFKTRAALSDFIKSKRIVVGTMASILGKVELFTLKSFDRCIIDEASQILEPMMLGILPYFKHFTLIGDHKQLPAVVAQGKNFTKVENTQLEKIGLKDLRDSYFERMYHRLQDQGWNHAYANLSEQGRCHTDLMAFPSETFYHGFLQLLPSKGMNQVEDLALHTESKSHWGILATQRRIFVNTQPEFSGNPKMNSHEALIIGELLIYLKNLFQINNLELKKDSIGIITPFRAQIACLKNHFEEIELDYKQIMVDTVERYQGGARDIIIISLCTNDIFQLDSMVSLNEEGIDRKLNVALTRARKQLIVLGNKDILGKNPLYKKWIEEAYALDLIIGEETAF